MHKEPSWLKDIFFCHQSYLSEGIKGRRLHLFEFIQPICCKCHSDAALQHDGQGHPGRMKVHLCQLLLIRKDIMRGQIPFCSLLIQFASIKENWALNPFGVCNSFSTGQKRRGEGYYIVFKEREGSEKTHTWDPRSVLGGPQRSNLHRRSMKTSSICFNP